MNRITKWWRMRQFVKAYMILRRESDRHRAAGHDVQFEAVNTNKIILLCVNCPEAHPLKKKH